MKLQEDVESLSSLSKDREVVLERGELPALEQKYGPKNAISGKGASENATTSEVKQNTWQENRTSESSNTSPEQKLGDEMRSALRHLTQPVALITSTQPEDPRPQNFRGVTVSSFCTVTLKPKPIVSFNLRVPSRTWDAISASGRLYIHLLHATQEGATTAHAFTLPYEKPHEPFGHLEKFGGKLWSSSVGHASPRIDWREAVHVAMRANLLPDKCIPVGDHVIVVAEVDMVKDIGPDAVDAGLLAYGRRGYRKLGEELKPLEEPVPKGKFENAHGSPSTLSNKSGSQAAAKTEHSIAQKEDRPKDVSELEPSSPIMDEKSLRSQMEQTEKSYDAEGFPNQTAAKEPMLEEALKAVAGAWKAPPDAGSDLPLWHSQRKSKTAAATEEDASNVQPRTAKLPPLWKHGRRDRARTKQKGPEGSAWHPNQTSSQQHRTFTSWTQTPARHYSTSSPPPAIPKNILKKTVAQYLCQPPSHPMRWRTLFETQRRTEDLNQRLQDALENKTLSEAEISDLEDELATNQRKGARMFAYRRAFDLKAMLDTGSANTARAQEVESILEQGQAAVLIDAKLLRNLYDEKRISREEFDEDKAKLTRDYETINAELLRLKDLVEEDDDVDDLESEEADAFSVKEQELESAFSETPEQAESALREFDEFFRKAEEKKRRRG